VAACGIGSDQTNWEHLNETILDQPDSTPGDLALRVMTLAAAIIAVLLGS
jgi:hypothetical protein